MTSSSLDLSATLAEFKDRSLSGYAMGLHIKYTTPTYFFQSYPRPWLEHYTQSGFLMDDPTVLWCFQNEGMCRWSDLPDPKNILGEAADFGMKFGVVYATNAGDSLSMCGFARPDREFSDAEIAELVERFDALHAATSHQQALPAEVVEQLKKMSIIVTHPGS